MKVIAKKRATNFLTSSGLRCLAGLPTVNISAGCAHKCVYCYTKGYSVYPGDEVVEVYEDMAERIADEVARKRKKPGAVYFCPSCDPFQPIEEVQQNSFEVMKLLLEMGIGVQFVTKGKISDDILDIFRRYPEQVCGQIGLTCVDDEIRQTIEPYAASVESRLVQLRHLVSVGVTMSVRCDPMIPGLADGNDQLEALFSAIEDTGCREAAVSYLFLRPAIAEGLRSNIKEAQLLEKILESYRNGVQLPIGMKSSKGTMLPKCVREERYAVIRRIADSHGISVHLCGCKNSDITNETCYITRSPKEPEGLFD